MLTVLSCGSHISILVIKAIVGVVSGDTVNADYCGGTALAVALWRRNKNISALTIRGCFRLEKTRRNQFFLVGQVSNIGHKSMALSDFFKVTGS